MVVLNSLKYAHLQILTELKASFAISQFHLDSFSDFSQIFISKSCKLKGTLKFLSTVKCLYLFQTIN